MSITTILFDLDGTLLPMDLEMFAKAYMSGLGRVAASKGYEPKATMSAVMSGTAAMAKNNGEKTNESVFWDTLAEALGESVLNDSHMYDKFYQTDFQKIKEVCGFEPRAKSVIAHAKEKGFRVVLATNPLFPSVATESRISWAGLDVEDFEWVTTYENSYHCKPNLDYYRDILNKLELVPEECLMVGNDVGEDMIASQLGMRVFLLTDCLINRKNEDISKYPRGSFDELYTHIDSLNT